MHEVVKTMRAPPDQRLNLWFEPWAAGLSLAPGAVIELRAAAPNTGELEIDAGAQGVAIYGWPGCTLQVFVDGELARDFCVPFPDLPTGMDMKQSMQFLFGPPPWDEAPPARRAWWRFWK